MLHQHCATMLRVSDATVSIGIPILLRAALKDVNRRLMNLDHIATHILIHNAVWASFSNLIHMR